MNAIRVNFYVYEGYAPIRVVKVCEDSILKTTKVYRLKDDCSGWQSIAERKWETTDDRNRLACSIGRQLQNIGYDWMGAVAPILFKTTAKCPPCVHPIVKSDVQF